MIKKGLFAFILLISSNLFSQTFSSDPAAFLKEMDKYLSASNRTKAKPFIEEFEPVWLNDFSSQYQQKVIATSNLIVEKRLPAFPDLHGYLLSCYSFVKTNQPAESFNTWHTTLDNLLNSRNTKKFKTFIEVCSNFFSDGSLYVGTKHLWGVRSGSYRFEFERNNPVIYFDDVTLYCYVYDKAAKRKENPYIDSTVIINTTGNYLPFVNKWSGRSGQVNWEKTGLDKATNYAEITDYSMSFKSTQYSCDTVEIHTQYYPDPLKGTFKDYATANIDLDDRDYPQFISFNKKILKKDILPEVDYIGGFSLNGASFTGLGFEDQPASLIFYKDGAKKMKASAVRLKINDKGIYAQECEAVMYLNKVDSIFHPGLFLNYDLEKVELTRGKEGLAQASFSDTYHGLDMYVDKLVWYKNDKKIDLEWNFGASDKEARLESKRYFDGQLYTQLQGLSANHPLTSVYGYYYKYDVEEMPIGNVASFMNLTTQQAIPILLKLANYGFITYDKNKQTIHIQPKTKQYIDAYAKKSDYDNIVFTLDFNPIEMKQTTNPDGSENKEAPAWNARAERLNARKKTKTKYGTIDLVSLDLKVNEVQYVQLSELQSVVVFPKDGELTIQDNRNFTFSGAVSAGKLETYPTVATFDYENFKINLLEVDETLLRVKPMFGEQTQGYIPMTSIVNGVRGEILIDNPENKSGNSKDYTDYPKLISKDETYVYYNHKSIFRGTYDSLTFYFKINPFEMDSLDNFDEFSLALDGQFRSSGIFPEFKEQLKIQEDYSFGFKTNAPKEGYVFYGKTDSKYSNDIRLSNNGLRGSGDIDYLTAHATSDDFVFFRDSTMGVSDMTNTGQTKSQGLEVPDMLGKGVLVTYVPKQDKFKTKATQLPIYLFNQEAVMMGETVLTPKGITGSGLIYFGRAEMQSKNYDFKRWIIDSDTSNFNLADVNQEKTEEQIMFNTENVNSHVDFEARKGEFKSNDGTSKVEFPQNQYYCYMDMFSWLMDSDEMELSKEESDIDINSELDLAGPNFFSTHPKQDSLSFAAPKAKFSLAEKVIYCDKIKFIDIADARISPSDEKITVRKKAKMDPFEDATIVANFITKYHTIEHAYVEVKARRDYMAKGTYIYTDSKEQPHEIELTEISPDTSYQTVGKGKIDKEQGFKLSEQFDFYGDVNLFASNEFLTFDGATRINHECDQFAKNWMKFRAEINPNDIQIPVNDDMKDLDGNSIAVGIVLRTTEDYDSLGIYPAFLSAKNRKDDKLLFTASGYLTYNESASEYRIASKEKLINRAEKGNYISLHTKSCSMNGDGRIDLQVDLPGVEFNPVGTINYNMSTGQTSMNLSGGLNYYYDQKAMEMNAAAITTTEELTGIDYNTITLEQAVKEDVDEESAENMKSDYQLKGEVKRIPKEMQKTIYFTNLRLVWDDRNKAFLSKEITGIVNILDKPIFKDFTVKLAVQYSVKDDKQKGKGNKLSYMIELPGAKYYYYHMERIEKETKMQVFTNDKELETYLLELKDDKLKSKDMYFQYANKTIYISQFKSLFGG